MIRRGLFTLAEVLMMVVYVWMAMWIEHGVSYGWWLVYDRPFFFYDKYKIASGLFGLEVLVQVPIALLAIPICFQVLYETDARKSGRHIVLHTVLWSVPALLLCSVGWYLAEFHWRFRWLGYDLLGHWMVFLTVLLVLGWRQKRAFRREGGNVW